MSVLSSPLWRETGRAGEEEGTGDSGLTSVKSRLHSCGAATTGGGGGGPQPPHFPLQAAGHGEQRDVFSSSRIAVRLAVNSQSARTRVLPAGGSLLEADSLTTRP